MLSIPQNLIGSARLDDKCHSAQDSHWLPKGKASSLPQHHLTAFRSYYIQHILMLADDWLKKCHWLNFVPNRFQKLFSTWNRIREVGLLVPLSFNKNRQTWQQPQRCVPHSHVMKKVSYVVYFYFSLACSSLPAHMQSHVSVTYVSGKIILFVWANKLRD